MNEAGLPIGVQLVSAFGREDLLLQVAWQLEQTVKWGQRRPAVVPELSRRPTALQPERRQAQSLPTALWYTEPPKGSEFLPVRHLMRQEGRME